MSNVKPTFKLDTRSAVSSRVNVLIWSTIWEILGLLEAAGAAWVDSHRRLLGVRRAVRYVAEVAMRFLEATVFARPGQRGPRG